ncbi:MAG: hypothetical protein RL685_2867 [Pseudomonadota bacterium]|jgi:hypothetical protein
MNQLKLSFVLASALVGAAATGLGGCSDDDGSNVVPKDPNAQAGSGGGGGTGGGDAMGGSAGLGGSGGSAGMSGSGGAPALVRPACPPEPAVVDAGVDDAGASDPDAGDPDAGDAGTATRALSFATDIHPIFRNHCRSCHEDEFAGGHNVAADDPAEAYGFLVEVAPRLVGRINGGGMPPECLGVPGDLNCVTVAELALIQSWESQCYPP